MSVALPSRHDFTIEFAREAGVLAATVRRSLGVLATEHPMGYATMNHIHGSPPWCVSIALLGGGLSCADRKTQ